MRGFQKVLVKNPTSAFPLAQISRSLIHFVTGNRRSRKLQSAQDPLRGRRKHALAGQMTSTFSESRIQRAFDRRTSRNGSPSEGSRKQPRPTRQAPSVYAMPRCRRAWQRGIARTAGRIAPRAFHLSLPPAYLPLLALSNSFLKSENIEPAAFMWSLTALPADLVVEADLPEEDLVVEADFPEDDLAALALLDVPDLAAPALPDAAGLAVPEAAFAAEPLDAVLAFAPPAFAAEPDDALGAGFSAGISWRNPSTAPVTERFARPISLPRP